MTSWMTSVLIGMIAGVGLGIWYRVWRDRRIVSRRVVEKPNSHYASQGVKAIEDRERWSRIDLAGLHPLNREEVVRLLDRVEREGVQTLTPRDRLFLDNLTVPRPG